MMSMSFEVEGFVNCSRHEADQASGIEIPELDFCIIDNQGAQRAVVLALETYLASLIAVRFALRVTGHFGSILR